MKWLSSVVIMYMLLALVWWAVLLFSKNRKVHDLEVQITEMVFEESQQEARINQLGKEFRKQSNMILGEGLVFGLSLLLGIWFIQRSFARELEASENQNNFLLSVTHELKSPLTSMKLGLETIKTRPIKNELIKDIAGTSLLEAKRLEKLIDDLLLSAKIDQKYMYDFQSQNIAELVNSIGLGFIKSRPEVDFNLVTKKEGLYVLMDKSSMEKVINNLIENGIKYGQGGPLTIDCQSDHEEVVLSVLDQGVGIAKEEKTKIFDKFYRVGSEETRKTKGTGIGLYIVKKIVDAHKGKIRVKDNKPKGSIFEVRLPKSLA